MKYFLKQFTLFYVVAGLVFTPYSSYAATKKHRSSMVVSSAKHIKSRSGYRTVKYHPSRIKVTARKSYLLSQSLPVMSAETYDGSGALMLASTKALVINQNTNEVIYAKNTNTPTPIASVTKLMTAMVLLDAGLNLEEEVVISDSDVDYLKGTSSRLPLGTQLTRNELLHLALIASENRAASALASTYPGGRAKFVRDMNLKAYSLGMLNTHYSDSTGLDSSNVSTAEDLAKLVKAAYSYDLIREITTTASYDVLLPNRHAMTTFKNTNILVRNGDWDIGLSKTGFINEAGRCLVMQAKLAGEPVIIVLLDSEGKYTRIGDANRVRKWVEHNVVPKSIDAQTEPITVGQIY
ncbi:MAG TPA: D-alanyl-D-alanine endopeptidase [Methylophilaceae bacterium]|nr:D-alanyl-D-alanine endopeptidase [Methylophilaceae bacterium]HAJ72173.1 D-alanyl-D-alanine endopeptidase [Methylophilaceae bacterium]